MASRTEYTANALNQYTSVSENGAAAFVPQFDPDVNQTLIKTETGIWSAVYNAENRPVSFANSESNTVVECAYDSQGRRAYKKVTINGSVTLHQRYIYRGYLQIAALDLTRTAHPALWYITWDPSQTVATRPLAIQINGTWYTYGIDLTKNICELYSPSGAISTTYTYSPFGQVTASGSISQPIQWSSELWDGELGLVYYNWRYYNAWNGRWCCYDIIQDGLFSLKYVRNSPIDYFDNLGLLSMKLLTPENKLFNAERIDGAFDFYWQFQMDDESKKHEGYIVQKIVYTENYEHHKGSNPHGIEYVSKKHVYWEAWNVFQYGFITPFDFFNNLRWHDHWKMQPKDYYYEICSKGIITVNSLAFFYSYGRIAYYENGNDNLRDLWGKRHVALSGSLPSTDIEPYWWGGKASYKEKTIENNMIIEWNILSNGFNIPVVYSRSVSIKQNGKTIVNYSE